MRLGSLLVICLLTCSCRETKVEVIPLSLKGNWYTDIKNGEGFYTDSLTNYCEYYIGDSIISYLEESNGPGHKQKYFIKGDSIFKCFFPESENKFIPVYKIEKHNLDTIWLSINPKYANGNPNTFWVRLPRDEYGIIDHEWNHDTRDSLEIKIWKDFDRRRWKFYSIRGNDMTGYDSALNSGYWNFPTK